MKFIKFFLAIHLWALIIAGASHTAEHSFELDHSASCLECLSLATAGTPLEIDDFELLESIVVEYLEFCFNDTSATLKNFYSIHTSRGPPLNLV